MLAVVTATVVATAAAEIAPEDRRSGYDFAGPDTRAMQDDDTANPGMLGYCKERHCGRARPGRPTGRAPTAMATREPA